MNKLNRNVEYALMALKFLLSHRSGQLSTVKEICEETGSPFDATSRVMQIMKQKGWLQSEQGAQGGYTIVKDLTRISFYDLVEVILGPLGVVKCIHTSSTCDLISKCNIQSPLLELNNRLTDFYKSLSIIDLLSAQTKATQEHEVVG